MHLLGILGGCFWWVGMGYFGLARGGVIVYCPGGLYGKNGRGGGV